MTVEHDLLSSLIKSTQDEATSKITAGIKVQSLLTSDLGAPLPLHISLSRPIGFATEQKDLFLTSMEENIASSGIRPYVDIKSW
jgi:hypothetical protein